MLADAAAAGGSKEKFEMRVGIATDHGGFELKEDLKSYLRGVGHVVVDIGARELKQGDDYPDFVIPLAEAVAAGIGGPRRRGVRKRRRGLGLRE